ncbi:hypothetical protein [Nitrosarchaeum sp. AC2]|uniref:hypothetical protein n=1 Tax=Nitrosarchaeum sp. AC2 TaxID=2259673 RepID=UPI0015CE644F|nr:hypothetical protein [Nitrosarchaeum sp. AC2]QLH11078.1 hypothetical protein DSQ20_06065 [Nitrosarchaeum sp. AC2]
MPFKIQYKFNDDPKIYHCVVSYTQYRNFCGLPIIQECKIIKGNETTTKKSLDEIQRALDLAYQKDTSHIRKLAENT